MDRTHCNSCKNKFLKNSPNECNKCKNYFCGIHCRNSFEGNRICDSCWKSTEPLVVNKDFESSNLGNNKQKFNLDAKPFEPTKTINSVIEEKIEREKVKAHNLIGEILIIEKKIKENKHYTLAMQYLENGKLHHLKDEEFYEYRSISNSFYFFMHMQFRYKQLITILEKEKDHEETIAFFQNKMIEEFMVLPEEKKKRLIYLTPEQKEQIGMKIIEEKIENLKLEINRINGCQAPPPGFSISDQSICQQNGSSISHL